MAQWLSERLGQPFIIENRPGAGTNIATEAVVRASPDGYTLLLVAPPAAINAALYDKLNFNFIPATFSPVGGIVRQANVMVVNPSLPAKTVPEFIAYAKANPGKINMASGGNGTMSHVAGELFKMMNGVDMVHVPYRAAAGPRSPICSAGKCKSSLGPIAASMAFIKADKLRPLAATTAARSESLPNLPTVGDFVPGYEAGGWEGVGAPKNTSAEIIDRLNKEINAALCRSDDEGSACRPGRYGASRLAFRLREACRRGNREVGQGGQVRGHQAGVISASTAGYSITSRSANPACTRS